MNWLISPAHAQTGGAAPGGGGIELIMLVVMVAVFYFFLIRPQQKRAKEHKNLVESLSKGDEVVTSGGILGRITKVTDEETSFGFGFDTNWSWLLGQNDNFYVAAGVGLKRLFGTHEGAMKFVPTIRIINVGLAF